ncbi:MAG: hypothetical protein JKY65_10420 [Planctomycetes bacterium]|nr:hypothetical protein [Planctomycetota bacterium]
MLTIEAVQRVDLVVENLSCEQFIERLAKATGINISLAQDLARDPARVTGSWIRAPWLTILQEVCDVRDLKITRSPHMVLIVPRP